MTTRVITLQINDETVPVHVRNIDTLLVTLREKLGLTGAKPGCLNGDCGACTVNIDGVAMKSCLMLAVEAENAMITTIEALKDTPLQKAFIDKFAFQCGYCTPGFIMNCQSLIQNEPLASDAAIKSYLESNICRCTGYEEIEEAIKEILSNQQK